MENIYNTQYYEGASTSEAAAGQSPTRVYILHKLPTPYNDMFFRALHEDDRIDLSVFHLWRGSWRRPWKSQLGDGYPNTYMRLTLGVDWKLLQKAWSDTESFFIVADWAHLASVAVILVRHLRRAPVSIWADTPQESLHRPPLKRWLRRKFLSWLLRKPNLIFGTGARALQVLTSMGARPAQLVSLPCFVDLNHPAEARRDETVLARAQQLRARVGCQTSGVVFSTVGTLIEKKGIDIALHALAECRRQSDTPVGLLIAGEGPEREKLERAVAELGLTGAVAFLGWQEPHEMDALYLASDAIVHPARYDPFPLVVLETMSWSRAIIGSDACGSIEDRVRHGVNGFSFPSENTKELAQVMLELSRAPERLREVGEQARKSAETWPVSHGVEIVRKEATALLNAPV